jgi:hypothetical protein
MAARTAAMDGVRNAAKLERSRIPYERIVTKTSSESTPRKPRTVATPMSFRFRANRE